MFIYVKSLSGDLTPMEVEEKTTLPALLTQLATADPETYSVRYTQLFREEGKAGTPFTEGEIVHVFRHDTTPRQILNRTEGTYLHYQGNVETYILPLFEKQADGTSRWRRSDEIVFVPETVPIEFIQKKYEAIHV